ncbi:MAG: hypothetical protein ACFE95_23210 [Candidatus Hodarchaeota archaeon]
MNRHRPKTSFFLIIFTVILFGLTVNPNTASSTGTSTPPIGVQRPQGLFQQALHQAFLWLVTNMESAGFTPDNVYYGVYDNVGTYTYPIVGAGEQEMTIDLSSMTQTLNTTIDRLKNDPDTDSETLIYLNNLYTELLAHEEVTIYLKGNSNVSITTIMDRKAVTIFYDKDRSVLDGFEKLKNNETVTEQPFNGDEILTNVFMSLIRDEITGSYDVINTWNYEDDSDASLLKDFIRRINDNRWLYNELGALFGLPALNQMRMMIQNTHSWEASEENPRVLEYGRFQISQLKIDELKLRKMGQNLIVSEYEYSYMEHHLLGSLVYNDTNDNGMMDIGVKTIPVGQYNLAYPTIGDEALYRFDIKNIYSRTYQMPQTTDDVLEFGSEFVDVVGYLQPIARNQDDTLFDISASQAYRVDEISTLFHFSVNNTDGSVDLKFDYVIGNWNDSETLEGFGFCQLMASTVVDAHRTRTFQWKNENNAELGDANENASKISRFKFTSAEGLFGEIRLDDIPYFWGDTQEEVNAVGQLIPMNLIEVTYGRISSEADLIRSVIGDATRKTYLYSISYPKWDGKSITHDPSFVVVGGLAAEDSDGTGTIPGFEFAAVFLSIPALALAEVYRRKRK